MPRRAGSKLPCAEHGKSARQVWAKGTIWFGCWIGNYNGDWAGRARMKTKKQLEVGVVTVRAGEGVEEGETWTVPGRVKMKRPHSRKPFMTLEDHRSNAIIVAL